MKNNRRIAAFLLAKWLLTKDFPANMLPSGPDRAFVQDLVYTTIRRLRALRMVLGELVTRWPKGELEALLYIGAAQILYMDDVPDFAAVNETVNAAKECDNPSIPKVVNGVLRNLIRQKEALLLKLKTAPFEVRESFPRALVARWIARFGEDKAEELCVWHNLPAETFLAYPDGRFIKLERGKRVEAVDGFGEGKFIVQDPATALAVDLISAQPGDEILDACASPGGKTIQLAWRGAKLTACEINPKRRLRLTENLTRVGLIESVKVIAELPSGCEFDKVLVDAPCSNTGVLRRKPDARWNWSVEKLNALVKLQAEILELAAKRVKNGGLLVYSTCSNEPEENTLQVADFLTRHPEFVLDKQVESLPFESGKDGAFAARLKKK